MKGVLKSNMMNVVLNDADYTKTSPFETNFIHKKRLNDPRFGDISIIQDPKTRELLAVRETKINDKKEAGQAIVNCRNRMQNRNPNILSLKDYSVKKQSELCSSFYIIKEFYEYPRSDLKREIQLREKEGETLSDAELTHILYQQIQANAYLQSKDQAHGDIQPLNIAYDKVNVQSKLIDKSADSQGLQNLNLQKNKLIGGHSLYQSPKMFSNLKKGNLKFDKNSGKEDTYALGLTLLEAGNGKSVQNIYDKTKGEVNQVALNDHLNEFQRKYGDNNTLLVSTVKSMVDQDENRRPDFRSLQESMPPYDEVKQFLNTNQRTNVQSIPNNNLNTNNNNLITTTTTNTIVSNNNFNNPELKNQNFEQNNFEQDIYFKNDFENNSNLHVKNAIPQTDFTVKSDIPQLEFPGSNITPQKGFITTQNDEINPYMIDNNEFQFNNQKFPAQTKVQGGVPSTYISDNSYSTTYQGDPLVKTTYQTNVQSTNPTYQYNQPEIRTTTNQTYQYNQPEIRTTNTNYDQNKYSYTNDSTYNTSYQSQPYTEVVTLEPEYRTEYLNKIDVNEEQRKMSQKYLTAPTNQTEVRYSQPRTYTTTNVQSYPTTSQQYVTQNSYASPITETVTQTNYNPSRNETYTQSSYTQPITNISQNFVTQTNTSGLKLLRTYEDPKFARNQ